ncbi:MAG: PAS domain-containing protein [Deltaproteobacteria bacterium]|nr:PAS domain-containing protein [Kofleriaceae bacterium]
MVVLGGEGHADIEPVLRALPPLDATVVLAADVDAPGLAALRRAGTMPIVEARDGAALEKGHIFLVPRRENVRVLDGRLQIERTRGEPADTASERLLRSVAGGLGPEAVVVLMPGVHGDHEHGLRRIKQAGGLTIQLVADVPETSRRAPVIRDDIDLVVPISELPTRLAAFERRGSEAALLEEDPRAQDSVHDGLRDLLTLVRVRTGHDFSSYKRATLYRRVGRRMQVCNAESIADYLRQLREDPAELGRLLRDFLISVTNFFRDPEAYEALEQHVIPRLFQHRGHDQVRVWVAGCASGEEAYSIAILLAEHAATISAPMPQVFATDIDETALAEARTDRYPESIALDVRADRLERFFERDGGSYRVRKELREIILFSPHNVLRDPPFSRLDLVTCRNLLIYLNRDAQDRVLDMFHFGLRPEGYLFLGSSETAESTAQQFAVIDAKQRIYARRLASTAVGFEAMHSTARWPVPPALPLTGNSERSLAFGELHHRVVEKYAPPSVLVNEELDIVHVSEHAGRFLVMAGGEPTRQLLRLVLPPLRLDLRSALYAARQPNGSGADTRLVRFEDNGERRVIRLETRSIALPDFDRDLLLVLFDERPADATDVAIVSAAADPTIEPVVREMEDELHRTREQLRTTIEQYETSLEELKASNEELHAINEELRSATEELETSKEEQQSINEELTTVNHELKSKVDEISRANSDLQNLMTSTDIGVLFLDRHLHIKRFTPRAQELVNVIATDIGRPLAHLTHRLDYDQLPAAAASVLQTLRVFEREVKSSDGRRFLARLLPYRSVDDRIEGVVVTFVDVTDLRAAEDARRSSEAALRVSEERFRLALRSAPLVALSQDADLRCTWGYILGREVDVAGKTDADVFGPAQADRLVRIKREILATGAGVRVEVPMTIDGIERTFDFRIEPTEDHGGVTGLRSMGFDITPSKVAEAALRDADARKDQFLATISHELRAPLAPLRAALDIQRLAPADPARVARSRAIMERQIDHLVRLVDDLLDVSRINEHKIQLERRVVELASIFRAAAEAVKPMADEGGRTLVTTPPESSVAVNGDPTRLTQIVVNLLTNAIKYTPRGGLVELTAAVEPNPGKVTIVVRDNGIGIAPELLPRIFDLFVQGADVAGRSSGGLGIGLNLVRRLAELHGGSVAAASDGPGRGAEMRVTLPLAPSSGASP